MQVDCKGSHLYKKDAGILTCVACGQHPEFVQIQLDKLEKVKASV